MTYLKKRKKNSEKRTDGVTTNNLSIVNTYRIFLYFQERDTCN